MKKFLLTLLFLLGASSASAQVVLNQASVPTCTNGQTLVYNTSTVLWECGTVGSGTTTGTGTSGTLTKWTGTSSLGNSIITESGATGSIAGTWSTTQLLLRGSTSGTLTVKPAAITGTNTLTFPAGTTDFTATGAGFLYQASSGAAITVTPAITATTGSFSSTLGVTGAFTGTSGAFSTTLGVTGLLSVGATPATTGAIGISNGAFIYARNVANSANLRLLGTDTSNNMLVGSGTTPVYIDTTGGTFVGGALSVTGTSTLGVVNGTATTAGSYKFGTSSFSDGIVSILGNASGSNVVAIKAGSSSSVLLAEDTAGNIIFNVTSAGVLNLGQSSSQVLVGAAAGNALNSGTAGAFVVANSANFGTQIQIGAKDDVVAYFNRKNSDGVTVNFFNRGATVGNVTTTSTTTTFNSTSDMRLKTDKGIATTVEVLRGTKVHDFDWKLTGEDDRGVFAQEALLVKPLAVLVGDDRVDAATGRLLNPWAVDYSKYVPDLIVGWQQHEARLAAIESRLGITNAPVDEDIRSTAAKKKAAKKVTDAEQQKKLDVLRDCQKKNEVLKTHNQPVVVCKAA